MKRISFDIYDAEHIYELALEHFTSGYCCIKIKKRLEKFIGKNATRRIKRIVKKYPYI